MIGKTVARVIDLGHAGQGIVFTDGTAVELQPMGYETDGVQIEECSEMDVLHEQALQENRRIDDTAHWKRQRERYEAGEMSGFELAVYEGIQDQYAQMKKMLSLQVFGAS